MSTLPMPLSFSCCFSSSCSSSSSFSRSSISPEIAMVWQTSARLGNHEAREPLKKGSREPNGLLSVTQFSSKILAAPEGNICFRPLI